MDDETINKYTEEARGRWGDTEAFRQSKERVRKMGKEGLKKVIEDNGSLTMEIALCMKGGEDAKSDRAQRLINKHYNGLRAFYEPNLGMYKGLAEMYIGDERFKANYEKVAQGLAQFMYDAMTHYVATQSGRN